MRAERRHELETNTLADLLGRLIRDYGEYLKWGGMALAALLVAFLIVHIISSSEERRAARAWEQFMIARDPEDYERIIREYEGLPAAYWAMLELADLEYSMGLDRLTRNPEEAETFIKKALERYKRAFEAAPQLNEVDPAFGGRALLGQAQCYEVLGDRENAIKLYRQVIELYPGTWMAERAQDRVAELEQPGAAEFYAALRRAAATAPAAAPSSGGEFQVLPPPATGATSEDETGSGETDASAAQGEARETTDQQQGASSQGGPEAREAAEGPEAGEDRKGAETPNAPGDSAEGQQTGDDDRSGTSE